MPRDCEVCESGMKDHLVHLHELSEGDLFVQNRGRYDTFVGRIDNITPMCVRVTRGPRERIVGDKVIRREERDHILSPHTEVKPWIKADDMPD